MNRTRLIWILSFLALTTNISLRVSALEEDGNTEHLGPHSTLHLRLQPLQVSIVLVGGQSSIQVQCALPTPQLRLLAQPQDPIVVKVLTEDVLLNSSSSGGNNDQLSSLQLLGLRPGRTKLDLFLLHASNRSVVRRLSSWDFEVLVVERLDAFKDGFLYLLLTVQVATLVMLAVRMRGTAVKEILRRPCSLFSAIFCQAVLVPLISIGVSVLLGLPLHSVVCLLILGCCPTGPLSPMLTVVQQGHVELAIIVTLIETCFAFGAMPLWLFAYGNFLGLAYDHVSAPYYFIAGALILVTVPVVIGLVIQRATPGTFELLDRAIPPSCMLLMLLEFTVNAQAFAAIWEAVTWRLLAGSGLLPVLGGILGTICSATFRQELPQSKSVAIVTCVQNTLLAKVIIQMSYPVPDASVMALTLTCVDFFTICCMLLAYIPHLCLTLCWSAYRPLHQHAGIGGLQDSIGDRIVRSMVKAGEITFGKLQQSPVFKRVMGSVSPHLTDRDHYNFGSLKGRVMYTGSTLDSAYRSDISSASRSSTPSRYPLKYFTDSDPEFPDRSYNGSAAARIDSLESLDYEMLSELQYALTQSDGGDSSGRSLLGQVVQGKEGETQEEQIAKQQRKSSPERPHRRMVPCFESLDIRKPLPPLPLPPTPPYLSRRLSCSDEALTHSDSRVSVRGLFSGGVRCPQRMRHTSAASSKSVRSDATQDTSVSSRPCDMEDLSESISTIMASYDMSLAAAAAGHNTMGTRWRWDAAGSKELQYSPPPPNISPARGLNNDLSSIEEERSVDNSYHSDSHPSDLYRFLPSFKETPNLSY